LRISVFIALFVSVVSFGHPGDTITTKNNEKLTSYIPSEKRDSLRKVLKFAPDLVFSTTSKKPFYQTGLNGKIGFEKIEKSSAVWGIYADFRSGLTTQGSIPYFSDPQTKSFVLTPLKYSIYRQPTSLYFDIIGSFWYSYKNFKISSGIGPMGYPMNNFSSRSIFNSYNRIANPYVMIDLIFSKSLNYSLRQDILREKIGNHFEPKGHVTHTLTYNHKDKFKLRLFETVVYQMKDTLYNRGFEVEYLNPFLFFRPQEYNMGSADNILLGTEFSFSFKEKESQKRSIFSTIYGQVLIDDFLLSAFRARNGWWGNKYGFNLGSLFSIFPKDSSGNTKSYNFYKIEFTYLRPYVFSQTNPGIVYGNQGLPIAHPLGSNFAELYQEYEWQKEDNKFNFKAFLQAYIKGVDSVGLKSTSYGGDIYKSYSKHPYEFNNKVGQGITLRTVQLGTTLSYLYSNKYFRDLCFYIEPRYRLMFFENHRQEDFFLTIGIQSNIWRNKDRLNY
jgi:hypothetical protein